MASQRLEMKHCAPCEGRIEACSLSHARQQMDTIPTWNIREDGNSIHKSVRFANFSEMIQCVNEIAHLAESEGHHPDLHLTGYRNLGIVLTTHSIGGLSDNDFIVAAKIDLIIKNNFPNVHAIKTKN